jgi:hypothetical protein
MLRLSFLFRALLGFFVFDISECFLLQSTALLPCSSVCRATTTKSFATQKVGPLQLKETKTCFGSRRSKISARVHVLSSLKSSASSATDKWEVLEQFQSTAEMDYFIVSDTYCLSAWIV